MEGTDALCLGYLAGKLLLAGEVSEVFQQQVSAPASTLSPEVSAILFNSDPVELDELQVFTDGLLNWNYLTEANIRRLAEIPTDEPDQSVSFLSLKVIFTRCSGFWKAVSRLAERTLAKPRAQFIQQFSPTCDLTSLPAETCWSLLQSGLGGCAILLAAIESKPVVLTQGLVGDIFSATAPEAECPRVLRDLLVSAELTAALGPDLVFSLRCIIGPASGLNLRNVLWHGFLGPAELAAFPALAFMLLVSVARHWPRNSQRPLLPLNTPFLLGPLVSQPPPLTEAVVGGLQAVVQHNFFLLPGRSPAISSALDHLQAWRENNSQVELHLFFALTLPQLEHSLRRIYVTLNKLPPGFLCANARVHYTTLDLFLIGQVELDDVPLAPNLLLPELGPGLLALLNDLFIYPEGPRLRDRISHGEGDLAQLAPPFVAMYTAVWAALLTRHSALLRPELAPLVAWAQDYRSLYHPLPKMRQELVRVQASLDTFQTWLRSFTVPAEAEPDSFEATYSLRSDESLEACVQSLLEAVVIPDSPDLLATDCTPLQLAVIVALRQASQELISTIALVTSKTNSLRQLVLEGQATRRLESSLYKLMSLLPGFALAFRCLAAFLHREAALLRAAKPVRAGLTVVERLAQRFEANEWTEAVKVMQQQLPPLTR